MRASVELGSARIVPCAGLVTAPAAPHHANTVHNCTTCTQAHDRTHTHTANLRTARVRTTRATQLTHHETLRKHVRRAPHLAPSTRTRTRHNDGRRRAGLLPGRVRLPSRVFFIFPRGLCARLPFLYFFFSCFKKNKTTNVSSSNRCLNSRGMRGPTTLPRVHCLRSAPYAIRGLAQATHWPPGLPPAPHSSTYERARAHTHVARANRYRPPNVHQEKHMRRRAAVAVATAGAASRKASGVARPRSNEVSAAEESAHGQPDFLGQVRQQRHGRDRATTARAAVPGNPQQARGRPRASI